MRRHAPGASNVVMARAPSPFVRGLCLVLAVATIVQLFYLGAQPMAVGLIPPPWDKLAHFGVYSAITALLWIGTAGRMPLAVIAAVVAVGALDELHQASLPGRSADAWDFVTDVCASAGTALALLLHDASGLRRAPTETPFS